MPSHEIRLVCLSRDLADTRSMNRVIAWHIDFTVLAELVVGATDRGDGSKGGRPRASAGRDSLIRASSSPRSGFNPRAHAGRGATRSLVLGMTAFGLFQSTRPRGARRSEGPLARNGGSFNPRAHAERDRTPANTSGLRSVSIHAPTRGATVPPNHPIPLRRVSIHAPTWGATQLLPQP